MKWEQVGEIGVDAGLCWVGDPCYILHTDRPPEEIGRTWKEFCDHIFKSEFDRQNSLQLNFDAGHSGLGVVVGTGYGDGCYPVYVKKNAEGRVIEVKVVFSDEDGEDR